MPNSISTLHPRTQELAYWINERESIRMRRESGVAAPWTLDPLMANVRYCNVHREDDKITRWLRSNPVFSGPSVPIWVVVLSRMVNRISSLAYIQRRVSLGDLTGVKEDLKTLRERGDAIWGNAYTISTCGKSMDKVDYVIDHVVQACMEASGNEDFWSCQSFFDQLTCIDGLGSFLAAQVVADLKNMPGHPLYDAPDKLTFVTHGPGSLRGLSAFWGSPVTPSTFKARLSAATALVTPFIANYVGPIHAQDMQNCFCELSKYFRVKEGGHARNRYIPK